MISAVLIGTFVCFRLVSTCKYVSVVGESSLVVAEGFFLFR